MHVPGFFHDFAHRVETCTRILWYTAKSPLFKSEGVAFVEESKNGKEDYPLLS